jgi:nucleotide-binding universal stress UspA family protein
LIPRSRVFFHHLGARPRVIAPVLMGQMARPTISIGDALAAAPGGSGNLLALVEIRAGRDNGVFDQEQRRRDMLRWVAGLEYWSDVRRRLSVTLRMTANLASSVRDAVVESEATSLVLEWPTTVSPRRHGLSDLTRQLLPDGVTDLVFVRSNNPNEAITPRSILASIRGGASSRTVASTAAMLADAYGSALTLVHIQTDSQHPDRSRREGESFEQIVEELHRPSTMARLHRHDNPAAGILEQAAGHDLVIIGSRLSRSNPNVLVGRGLLRTVRQLDCPVVMVRPKNVAQSEPAYPIARNGHRA